MARARRHRRRRRQPRTALREPRFRRRLAPASPVRPQAVPDRREAAESGQCWSPDGAGSCHREARPSRCVSFCSSLDATGGIWGEVLRLRPSENRLARHPWPAAACEESSLRDARRQAGDRRVRLPAGRLQVRVVVIATKRAPAAQSTDLSDRRALCSRLQGRGPPSLHSVTEAKQQ